MPVLYHYHSATMETNCARSNTKFTKNIFDISFTLSGDVSFCWRNVQNRNNAFRYFEDLYPGAAVPATPFAGLFPAQITHAGCSAEFVTPSLRGDRRFFLGLWGENAPQPLSRVFGEKKLMPKILITFQADSLNTQGGSLS
ncbi:hypothetical protein TNCV_3895871 [Trichonephila clavipes]|nr:hypothetical protein TNCV_3895871 [Trichonephila clavipes]